LDISLRDPPQQRSIAGQGRNPVLLRRPAFGLVAETTGDRGLGRDAVARLVRGASIVKGSFADLIAITGRRDILWLADHAPKAV
jgi:hypothetical protein